MVLNHGDHGVLHVLLILSQLGGHFLCGANFVKILKHNTSAVMATLSNFLERVSMIMLLSAISSPLSSMKGNIPFLERCLHLWSTFCKKIQTLQNITHCYKVYLTHAIWSDERSNSKVCPGEPCLHSLTVKRVDVHKLPIKRNKAWIKFKLSCHWKCPTFLPSGPRPHLNYFSLPTSQSMFDKNIGLDTNWIKSSHFKLQINDYSLINFQDTEDRSSDYHMECFSVRWWH